MSFTNALEQFEQASPWLDDIHEPEITALRFIADALDNATPSNPAPLLAQWGLLLRSLRKEAPAEAPDSDPLEQALRESGLSLAES